MQKLFSINRFPRKVTVSYFVKMPVRYKRRPRYRAQRASIRQARFRELRRARGQGVIRSSRNSIALRNARTGGLLGIEHKFLDIPRTPTALAAPTDASGGEINPSSIVTGCLSAPAQGDGPTNREGNKIVIDSVLIQGDISVAAQADQTAADVSPVVFIALVQDMQTNGATLNSEDVFTNPAANAVLATSPFRNMSYTARFKVLKMWKKQLRIPDQVWDGTNIEQSGFRTPFKLSWKAKGRPIPVTFTTASTTADVANVTNNSIHCIAYCNDTSLAPTIGFNCRIRFYG